MRRNVSMLLQRMQNVVPFVILYLLKKLYQHSLGICFFFAYTSLIFNLNQRFSNQVALKVRCACLHGPMWKGNTDGLIAAVGGWFACFPERPEPRGSGDDCRRVPDGSRASL